MIRIKRFILSENHVALDRFEKMGRNDASRRAKDMAEVASMAIFILGLFLIGILLLFLIRVQRGLLGLILAGLAAALTVYWLTEIRRMVKGGSESKPPSKKWTYDIIEGKEAVTVVAEVPGPAENVKVELRGGSLTILGGESFKKKVSVSKDLRLGDSSYVNGVLNVRLKKPRKTAGDGPEGDTLSFENS